ncbi:hypothetical protein [Anaerocaecibacter muris]|jgi:hypothetical protein|uniref:hypothetical protein n=1 Tax=Anaerocaecibacter muris TaxID=2941513 RepID=UPI003F691D9F
MKKIETSFGALYIEEENDREETHRIKIFDSEMRYFDYYSLDYLEEGVTISAFVEEQAKWIEGRKSLDDLLEGLGIDSYSVSEDWSNLLEDMYHGDAQLEGDKWIDKTDGSEITEQVIMKNEWVNKIGNTYILICE